MVDILFLTPQNKYRNYGDVPPLGVLSVASFLSKKGISVKIVDLTLGEAKTKDLLLKYSPKIVCLEDTYISSTETRLECFKLAQEIKKHNSEIIVVYQGIHATFTAEDTLSHISEIDVIVKGESEQTIYELLQHALRNDLKLKNIAGLAFRNSGKITHTSIRTRLKEIDDVEMDYALLELSKYSPYCDCDPTKAVAMVATRGCWARCNFCAPTHMWAAHYGQRPIKNVVDEMEFLVSNYDFEGIKFQDLSLTLNKRYVGELCSEISKRNFDVKWTCRSRADVMSKELLQTMKSAGCYKVAFGLETASPRLQGTVNKGVTLDHVKAALKNMDNLGMHTKLFFIYGLPTETYNEALMTYRFIRSNIKSIHDLCSSVGTVYPGTYMEMFARENGLLPKDFSWSEPFQNKLYWEDFHTNPTVPRLIQPQLNHEQLKNVFRETNKRRISIPFLKEKIRDIGTERGVIQSTKNFYNSMKFNLKSKLDITST